MKRALVVSLCATYALVLLAAHPPGPVTSPDTAGLLAFSPVHWLGYPVFIKVVGTTGAMFLQPVLYAAAVAALGLETLQLTSSGVLSVAVVLSAFLIPEIRTYHYSVLSESLFMSGTVAFLASVVAFVRRPALSTIVVAVVIASLTSTIRNAAIVYLPVAVLMVLLVRQTFSQWRVGLIAVIVPAMVIIGGERLAARVMHGDELTSLVGRHSFAKAALLDAAEPDVYAPVRELLAAAPAAVRDVLTVYYETCLQGPCVEGLGTSDPSFTPKSVNQRLEKAGMARLSRVPEGYVALTAREYRAVWKPFRLRDPQTVIELNAFVAAHRPLPYEAAVFKVGPRDPLTFEPSGIVSLIQPAVLALGLFTAILALVVFGAAIVGRRLTPVGAAAGLAALAAHASLLFSVMFAAALGRFTLASWPAVTTSALLGVWAIASSVRDVGGPGRLRDQDLHLEQLDERFRA